MSYIPTLLILKKDLDKNKELIIDGDWQYKVVDSKTSRSEKGKTVMGYLKYIYQEYTSVKIGGIELFLCTPQLSAFSTEFRKKLKELQIEYAESN